MAIRVFRCDECGHRLRLNARKCGACFASTPSRNRLGVPALAALALMGGALAWLAL